jgi:DNA-binding NarL/FixJ family response regulator
MATQPWDLDSHQSKKSLQRLTSEASLQTESRPLRIMMADDHAIVLEGLQLSLEAAGMTVVGTAQNARQTLDLLKQIEPDVLLTDLHMPGMNGLELLRRLRQEPRTYKIVILTGEPNSQGLEQARALGADGYLSKDLSSDKLASAVRQVADGERVYLLSEYERSRLGGNSATTMAEAGLSEQEIEVLRLMAQALDNREIASVLVVSENTIKSHVSSILAKLGVANRTQAALWALRHHSGTGS